MAVSLTKYRTVGDPSDSPIGGHTNPALDLTADESIRICVDSPTLTNQSMSSGAEMSPSIGSPVSPLNLSGPLASRDQQQSAANNNLYLLRRQQQASPSSQDSGVAGEQQQVIEFDSSSSSQHSPVSDQFASNPFNGVAGGDEDELHLRHSSAYLTSASASTSAPSSRSESHKSSSGQSQNDRSSDNVSLVPSRPGPAIEGTVDELDSSYNNSNSSSNTSKQQSSTDSTRNNRSTNGTNNKQINFSIGTHNIDLRSHKQHQLLPIIEPRSQRPHESNSHNGHFEIRWSNLSYQVEPKWYACLTTGLDTSSNRSNNQTNSTTNTTTDSRKKLILNNLNGSVRSGQVTAILGPSGAGKTSLLGCLTGKNRAGVSGTVQVLGGNPSKPLAVCTIPQKDYLLNQLTVRENLWFASRLKNPDETFDHEANIQRVLDMLKLQSCVDTKISKISGGQYKRVSIAQELLSNPDILILDEPTSGLDSLTCYRTVMVLRDLAELSPNPMAIIVTIHQPQREVYDLFHHVYILAIGGQAIYEGPPSDSVRTIDESSGLHYDSHQYNPASYFVEIASAEFGPKPIELLVENQLRQFRQRTQALLMANDGQEQQQNRNKSPMLERFKLTLGFSGSGGSDGTGGSSPKSSSRALTNQQQQQNQQQQVAYQVDGSVRQATSNMGEFFIDKRLQAHKHNHKGHFKQHCRLLTKRSWLCLCKDPMLTTLRFAAHIIVPLLITLVYGNRIGQPNGCPSYESDIDLIKYAKIGAEHMMSKQDELRTCFENVGLFFLSVYAFTFSTMCLTSLSFPLNMHVLLKEVRNGWYSLPTYFIGKTLADFPLEFILPVVTLMITYPLTGQPSSYMEWRFLVATLVFVVTSLIAQTQGIIFGALFMNAMQAAVFVAPVSTTPLILLSGFLVRVHQMPGYLQFMSLFSYFRYAIESLAVIRYGFGICDCDPTVVTGKPITSSGVPDQLRTMTNYWLSTFDDPDQQFSPAPGDDSRIDFVNNLAINDSSNALSASGGVGSPPPVDFFQDLTNLLARANSFGYNITTCADYKSVAMYDFNLKDQDLWTWLCALFATLIFFKIVNYYVVKYSVKLRL